MTYRGHVKNGVVVLDDEVTLPEGTEVSVDPLGPAEVDEDGAETPTLYERLKPFIGKAEGLPPDASINHDHYLYGTPKRE